MKTRFSATLFGELRKTGATALLFATFFLAHVPPSYGFSYLVCVANPTPYQAYVYLHYGPGQKIGKAIAAGSSECIRTSWLCPNGLEGTLTKGWREDIRIQGTDMYGTFYEYPNWGAVRCETPLSFKICSTKSGDTATYYFCKYQLSSTIKPEIIVKKLLFYLICWLDCAGSDGSKRTGGRGGRAWEIVTQSG